MHGILRMAAVVLLLTIPALPGAQAMPLPAPPAAHPAGCHSHGPAIPSPAPTSYQCCGNGHHAAIPNALFSLRSSRRSLAAQLCSLEASENPGFDGVACFHCAGLAVASTSPPGIAPLRI
jgi:hypothetical protein